jgi:hypothetical protein
MIPDILRLLVWVGGPLLLIVLAVGPHRVQGWLVQAWTWVFARRLSPEQILTHVVKQHQDHIAALKNAMIRMEAAEHEINEHIDKSRRNISDLEQEARRQVARGDDTQAKGALYKLNLEQLAIKGFEEHRERQELQIAEARRRLYLRELQLRQYEVGRTILLSQLAEAQTVEQQYDIARSFDPFHAVANWRQAEGMVQEKTLNARAVEQVVTDLAEIPLIAQPAEIDRATLDRQLAELKAGTPYGKHGTDHSPNGSH